MTLEEIYQVILDRKKNRPKGSYVSSLFDKGLDRIAQKVGEEGVEVVIASKNNDKKITVSEITDLFFHTLILMAELGIEIKDIQNELARRHKKN